MKVHALKRKSGQFIMLRYSYAPVHSICTSDTSSSLFSDLLRRSARPMREAEDESNT